MEPLERVCALKPCGQASVGSVHQAPLPKERAGSLCSSRCEMHRIRGSCRHMLGGRGLCPRRAESALYWQDLIAGERDIGAD